MNRLYRSIGALAGLLALSACLVTPGKFESSLDIRADRSFSFAYKGEVLASDMGKDGLTGGASSPPGDDGQAEGETDSTPTLMQIAAKEEDFSDPSSANDEAQMQAIATALAKEKGFRAARYMGNHKFEIDYAISGRLTHAFLFPFNIDAQIVLPFVAVELRSDDRVRVKAPGFSNGFDKSQGPTGISGGSDNAAMALDGRFTLTTDAEIVSQNQEDGAESTPQGKRIVWTINPLTGEAPAATLRVAK
ncbi:hypothetical protein [Sphingobium sp.]|uniref:hypothetical protein n=1 Tax=Sphingobium sp. TaxID=1912891 RepID=UPI003B3BB6BC